MQPRPCTIVCATLVSLLLLTLSRLVLCCFPVDEAYFQHSHWQQTPSFGSKTILEVGRETNDMIVVSSEDDRDNQAVTMRCMMAYGENRFLVKVEDEHGNAKYQCIHFQPLTSSILRQAHTEQSTSRKRVDCIDDPYKEDPAVLVASLHINPAPCPFSGGYQLILDQAKTSSEHCINSVVKYNPRMQFQCDGHSTGSVIVDFGPACKPAVLTELIGERQIIHLKCVGNWAENQFHSVLLQMRDHPDVFWCLHYTPDNGDVAGIFSIFLTLDGGCISQPFLSDYIASKTSMFGTLIAYKEASDIKCVEKVYLKSCELNKKKCLETTECPENCGRCQKPLTHLDCSFPTEIHGTWKDVSSRYHLEIRIETSKIISFEDGDLICERPPDLNLTSLYSVVQVSSNPTCMPYMACVRLLSLSPGILTYKLYNRRRSNLTGEYLSCKQSLDIVYGAKLVEYEEATMLINLKQLRQTPCKRNKSSTYPTLYQNCKLVIDNCTDKCTTLNISFEFPECVVTADFDIDNFHTCYASINFHDGVQGILAKSSISGNYLCWLFGSTRLFIVQPEDCNQKSVNAIFGDAAAHIRYDPAQAISLKTKDSGSRGGWTRARVSLVLLCGLFYNIVHELVQ